MSDSDKEDCIQQPALYIDPAEIQDSDLNLPPTSGHEYLRRVQEEAKHCPKIVVANIDTSKFLGNQTVTILQSDYRPAPVGFAPCQSWQINQVANFSNLRLKMSAFKARRRREGALTKPPMKLPNMNDDVGWCQLCFGSSPPTNMKDSTTLLAEDGMPPLLSIVCAMSQPLVEQVLNFHISWLELTGFTPQQGRWFYALLSCLEKPLTPEACSSLRSLARCCAKLRAILTSKDDAALVPLNLLICLVACYFDQQDLADVT